MSVTINEQRRHFGVPRREYSPSTPVVRPRFLYDFFTFFFLFLSSFALVAGRIRLRLIWLARRQAD